jgi:hypothetical protein
LERRCQISCCESDGYFGHRTEAETDLFEPYRPRLHLERWADGMNVVGDILERNLIVPTTGSVRTQKSVSQKRRNWMISDLALEGTAQQMLDLQMNLQNEVQETMGRANSNLTADIPIVYSP